MHDVERRISRLENQTESIYDLVDGFRAETRERLGRLEAFADEARLRFDGIDSVLGEVVRRLPSQ